MRKVVAIVFLLAPLTSLAQFPVDTAKLNTGNILSLNIDGHLGSTVIHNRFLEKFVYGGEIDSIMKTDLSESLSDNNRISGEAVVKLKFVSNKPLQKIGYNWYVSASYNRFESLRFSDDLFDLVFFGNQKFEDQVAGLDMNYRSFAYQKLTFGIYDLTKGLSLGVSLIENSRYTNINTQNSELYTGINGSSIDLKLQTEMAFTDFANSGLFAWNGIGAAVELSYTFFDKINVSVSDVGFVYSDKQTKHLDRDTSYNYIGFDVADIVKGNVSFDNIEDSLNLVPNQKGDISLLPFVVDISKPIDLNSASSIKPYYGLRYRYLLNTIPEIYGGAGYQPSESTLIHGALGYGGYYGLHLRAGLQMYFSGKFKLTMDSFALLNSITQTGKGKSIRLGFYVLI